MTAVDSSVIVAGFSTWHVGHEVAVRALADRPVAPVHALLEAYSVLTRLPPPHRSPPDVVASFLTRRFDGRLLSLHSDDHLALLDRVAALNITGGAIHDALIGLTAQQASHVLLTRDLRARRTYELLDVAVELAID